MARLGKHKKKAGGMVGEGKGGRSCGEGYKGTRQAAKGAASPYTMGGKIL